MKAPRTARFNGFCWEHQQKTNWKDPPFYSWENPRTFDWAMASIAFCRFTRPGAPKYIEISDGLPWFDWEPADWGRNGINNMKTKPLVCYVRGPQMIYWAFKVFFRFLGLTPLWWEHSLLTITHTHWIKLMSWKSVNVIWKLCTGISLFFDMF